MKDIPTNDNNNNRINTQSIEGSIEVSKNNGDNNDNNANINVNLDSKPQLTDIKIGKPKSGKPWKKQSKKSSNVNKANPGLKRKYEERRELRMKQKEFTEKLAKMRAEKNEELRKRREKQKEKEKLKQENEMKSSTYQLIKDTTKVRKWSKKARNQLAKLPPSLFEKVIKKEYGY